METRSRTPRTTCLYEAAAWFVDSEPTAGSHSIADTRGFIRSAMMQL
jgi:hypothetical protein